MFKNKKVLLVCSPYYKKITQNLLDGAVEVLKSNSVEYKIIHVPGALEIAPSIKIYSEKVSQNDLFDGFIALGCIIRGETYHFELIANETSRKIMDLSIDYDVAIGFGILTCNNLEQALVRSDVNKKNKGREAALACIELLK